MVSRRLFLSGLGLGAAGIAAPVHARTQLPVVDVDLRGSIDASAHGIRPGADDRKSKAFARLLKDAAAKNTPVFLPPGDYVVSNITLPDNTRLTGVPGATRIVYGGDGHLFAADGAGRIELANLVIDGANRWLGDTVDGLVHFSNVANVIIENCEIQGSSKTAVSLQRCGGRVERSRLSGAAEYALYAVESRDLSVTGNHVFDCGNGGILIHRWEKGRDGTIVSGNRIARISATHSGTGQYGNGINIFRADAVMISNNHISGCAFSAIRANAGSNVQIAGNTCLDSGETAIYSEFGFEGALVNSNLVDGAANGILIVNFDEGGRLATVSGNVVRNLKLEGPYVHDGAGFGFGIAVEADTVVSGNTVENAPKWGLMLGWGPYMRGLVVSGNLVRQSPVGCAVTVVEEAGSALISGNIFEDTPNGAIAGYRWNERTTGDLASEGSTFAHLTIERNRTG
ncbi:MULTISPECIES: TIGR03808 family TAT-translocated repetitive protein [unclassified Shinella]|uniref:TIGR03808 family TAT-translocated repetitive protein n=1 Tax=unclassified Shinella TaxID=2643062 RepID=UPI00234EFF79|nr:MULTISPECIES: TIGR03808 family TAT-translocated repetitive protein [unclassified Shinella]MCO5150323.1 TIGR03808 family TAT-translocated repetitive protein [Shinella sp.]MDC7261270.1 TIGR03808 family TAT-translocated repetitive protein [Shinella sp. HY16]MDC7268165.1 TIGR03808 family TAT-translocated repetitive protein [Shinella sp. YZ44]